MRSRDIDHMIKIRSRATQKNLLFNPIPCFLSLNIYINIYLFVCVHGQHQRYVYRSTVAAVMTKKLLIVIPSWIPNAQALVWSILN